VGKAKVYLRAAGITAVGDEGGQVIEDDREVNVSFAHSGLNHFQPNAFQMRVQGVQRSSQPVVIELGRWDAQQMNQHRPAYPVGYLILRQRKHEPVEDENNSHRAVVNLAFGGAMAIDDMANLERLQQSPYMTGSAPIWYCC
jgi:hypothetical protein